MIKNERLRTYDQDGKEIIPRQGKYIAADIVKWRLPRQNFDYDWLYSGDLIPGQILLTFSRCKTLKVKVFENEQPAAFRRTGKGYIALYDRTNAVNIDKIFEHEIFNGSYIKCRCGVYSFYKISFHEKDDLTRYGGERKTFCKQCGQDLIFIPARKIY